MHDSEYPMKSTFSVIILCFSLTFIACSETTEVGIKNTFTSPVPISEIQERLELSTEESIEKVKLVLEKHLFEIPHGFSKDLKFSTTAKKITDEMCEGQYLKKAPLPCEIKIHGVLIPKSDSVTTVRMIYQETCLGQHHILSSCKDSNAEKLLFSILQGLKE